MDAGLHNRLEWNEKNISHEASLLGETASHGLLGHIPGPNAQLNFNHFKVLQSPDTCTVERFKDLENGCLAHSAARILHERNQYGISSSLATTAILLRSTIARNLSS